jgi:hypothetical protein
MKVVPYGEIDARLWDETCDGSALAWLFHRHAWVNIECRHFRRPNYSFGLVFRDRLVGLLPLYFGDARSGTNGERLLHSGIHRETGLVTADELIERDLKAARSAAMREVLALANRLDVDRIQLNSHNLAPANLGPSRAEIPFWVADHGFELGLAFASEGLCPAPGMATVNADQIVDLEQSEEQLFARLDEACRRAVRKAQSYGLEFIEGTSDAVEDFYQLAQLSAQRTGETLAPIEYYRDIARAFAAERRCAVLFARRQGRNAAAVLLGIDKAAASFLGGASDPELLALRVNDFVHWSAICWAKRSGIKHYRFGAWFPSVDPEWPIAKVSRFKSKFGACPRTIIQGSLFLHPGKYLSAGRALLQEVCAGNTAGRRQ